MLIALLSACAAPSIANFSIEELLRAPQPSPEQNAVQKALNSHFGETLQLKYPRFGTEMTPFIIRDFDNDGQNEAAVLYTSTVKGQNVHLAILENTNGSWAVVQEIEGLAAEVLLVDSISLYENVADCLVVGYTAQSLNDKYLAIYTYANDTLQPVFNQAYASYAICDIDKDLLQEVVYVQTAKPSLCVVEAIDNELKISYNHPIDERFTSCLSLVASTNGVVAIDGVLQGTGISSALYSLEEGRLTRVARDDVDIFNVSKRYVPSLLSYDIDKNNAIDVPAVLNSIDTFNTTRRFYIVSWNDFTLSKYEKSFGIYDSKYNYYVSLPNNWKDKYNLMDDGTEDGGWQLRSKDGYKMILSAKIAPRSVESGVFTNVANLGEKRLLFSFGDTCTKFEINKISTGVCVF